MADYYAILKRAISALPKNTGEARRAIYEKARRALVTQLQNYDPPLSPSEITAQRLTLEEAVRKVEAEAARESLGLSPLGRAGGREPAAKADTRSQPSAAAPATPAAAPQAPASPTAKPASPVEAKPEPAIAAASEEPAVAREPKVSAEPEAAAPAVAPEPIVAAPGKAAGEAPVEEAGKDETGDTPRSGRNVFRDAVEEASKLGAASAEATRSARRALYRDDVGSDEADDETPQRVEPVVDKRKEKPEPATPEPDIKAKPKKKGKRGKRVSVLDDDSALAATERSAFDSDIAAEPMSMRGMWMFAMGVVVLVLIAVGAWIYAQRDTFFPSGPASSLENTATNGAEPAASEGEGESLAPKITDRLPGLGDTGPATDARAVQTMRVTAPTEEETVNGAPAEAAAPSADATSDQPADDQTTEEPPEDAAPQASTASDADAARTDVATSANTGVAVGQRAILYEEGATAGASGQAYRGQVVWKLAKEPSNGGEGTDTVLIATAEIPNQDTTIELKFRPNHDKGMPASHWIEVSFTLPDDFRGKGIGNVPGLILKTTEEARGDALRGASARVLDNLFWIALSKDPDEEKINEDLLTGRGWIDIPILYESGKRAILTLEKGTPGDKLVKEAFADWKKQS